MERLDVKRRSSVDVIVRKVRREKKKEGGSFSDKRIPIFPWARRRNRNYSKTLDIRVHVNSADYLDRQKVKIVMKSKAEFRSG